MSPVIDAGSVQIRLQGDGAKVISVQVVSQRPQVARVLKGRPADAAAALVPRLFSLCARAQGTAARLAVAAARGEESAPGLDPDVVREVMREHLWRWLIELPLLFGRLALREQFSIALRALDSSPGEALRGLLAAPEIICLVESIRTLEQPPLRATALLRIDSAQASLDDWPLLSEAFCRTPTWRGKAAETGALARCPNNRAAVGGAFAARWLARLAELETWAADTQQIGTGGTASAVPVAPGIGRAVVETARGLLMHEVVLEDDRVADYRIVAPTEWNFHPQGPLSGWLIGRPCADQAELLGFAAQAVAALDPCVRWELRRESGQPPQ